MVFHLAGFFAEEFKENGRISVIFQSQLLVELASRHGAPAFDPAVLASSLARLGAEFTTEFSRLRQLIEDRQVAILLQLVGLNSATQRNTLLLGQVLATAEVIKGDTKRLVTQFGAIEAKLDDIRALATTAHVGGQPFGIRPYAAERFFGRVAEKRALIDRLSAGQNSLVIGPAGLGKTAFAAQAIVELAGSLGERLAASAFPDGVVLLDLYRTRAAADPTLHALADTIAGRSFEPRAAPRDRAQGACA